MEEEETRNGQMQTMTGKYKLYEKTYRIRILKRNTYKYRRRQTADRVSSKRGNTNIRGDRQQTESDQEREMQI